MRTDTLIQRLVVPLLICTCTSGCVLGPGSLRYSRTNYNRAVQMTAREELLLNLVRMRYDDSTQFVRIPSITGQYSYDTDFSFDGRWQERVPNILTGGFSVGMQSKPTIVYAPEQDQEFTRRLLSPISGETLDLLTSKGWAVDRLLRILVRNINDVDNATPAGGPTPLHKPEFEEFRYVTQLLRQLQLHGRSFEVAFEDQVTKGPKQLSDELPIDRLTGEDLILAADKGYEFRISPDGDSVNLWRPEKAERVEVLRFSDEVRSQTEVLEICRILELDPERSSYIIRTDVEGQLQRPNSRRTGAPSRMDRDELVVSTRSPKEAMYFLSQIVEVPESHIENGVVRITMDQNSFPFDWHAVMGDLFQIHCSKLPPHDAAVRVKYRGYWFYIHDCDISSKSTFNLMLELFNLEIRGGGGQQLPLLTI